LILLYIIHGSNPNSSASLIVHKFLKNRLECFKPLIRHEG